MDGQIRRDIINQQIKIAIDRNVMLSTTAAKNWYGQKQYTYQDRYSANFLYSILKDKVNETERKKDSMDETEREKRYGDRVELGENGREKIKTSRQR